MSIATEDDVRNIFGSLRRPLTRVGIERTGILGGSIVIPQLNLPTPIQEHNRSFTLIGNSLTAPLAVPTEPPAKEKASMGFFPNGGFASNSFVNRILYLSNPNWGEKENLHQVNQPAIKQKRPRKVQPGYSQSRAVCTYPPLEEVFVDIEVRKERPRKSHGICGVWQCHSF